MKPNHETTVNIPPVEACWLRSGRPKNATSLNAVLLVSAPARSRRDVMANSRRRRNFATLCAKDYRPRDRSGRADRRKLEWQRDADNS